MIALLIDPSKPIEEFITVIDIDNYSEITRYIGGQCQMFTTVATQLLGDNTGYVDDEGLYNGQITDVGTFFVRDYQHPLAGRCVVQGIDWDTGESVDCNIQIDDAREIFGYPTPFGPVYGNPFGDAPFNLEKD